MSALVAEVLALPIDVLYTPGTQTALVAKNQTTRVPIVFQSGDPVGAGLVTNLAHPGGNLTGVSILSGEYSKKWLELLKEAVPNLRRVGVLWNPDNPVIAMEVEQMRRAAPGLGLELAAFPARAKDIDISLAADAQGLPLVDLKNPDPALRTRPLWGSQFFMVFAAPASAHGRTVKSTIPTTVATTIQRCRSRTMAPCACAHMSSSPYSAGLKSGPASPDGLSFSTGRD